jgi:DUF1707 SHOCT-like domain
MDDRIRASDADREHVTARLREHFAAGRLSPDELDERISAALNAKTHGELRQLMADLPGPGGRGGGVRGVGRPPRAPYPAAPPWLMRRRGPRLAPVLLLVVLAALLLHGGHWFFFGLLPVFGLLWLGCLAGLFALSHRHRHRHHT